MKTTMRIGQLFFGALLCYFCIVNNVESARNYALFTILFSVWYNEELLKEIRRNQ